MTSIYSHASSDHTLVDSLHFVLSHDSPTYTTIRGPGGRRLYRITSDDRRDPTYTRIERDNGEPVATFHWSKLGIHRVSLAGGPPKRVGKFLHIGPIFSE
ncbi:hypothetical protein PIIN_00358 [Serendipita indica DSM 11827]|uniref:DUF6593 domain-containing protein n=1 Tax=Serendipita indica (strain DSM 11827) TaxID=1109443 RepID=G4T5P6_SERID|nr:hypothetical protein PIIN_00358 [Serendipita indica DSM 11827]